MDFKFNILRHTRLIKEYDIMKIKMVCDRDNETRELELPMDEEELLKIQGQVLDRDTLGYIVGIDVNCYDEGGNRIDNVFLLNRQLQK